MQSDQSDGDSRQIKPTTFTVSQLIELLQPYADCQLEVEYYDSGQGEDLRAAPDGIRVRFDLDGAPRHVALTLDQDVEPE